MDLASRVLALNRGFKSFWYTQQFAETAAGWLLLLLLLLLLRWEKVLQTGMMHLEFMGNDTWPSQN